MIASDPCPWYPVPSMNLQIGQKRRPFAPALRGLLTVCLTFAYIIVGVAGEIACAGETLGSVEQAEQVELAAVAGQSDQDSKKPPVTVVDHCYTCVPLLVPPPVLVEERAAKSIPPTYATPNFLLEDHQGLDTPPPKYPA